MDVSVSDPSSKTRSPVLKEVRLRIFCSLAVSKPGGDDEDRDIDGVVCGENYRRLWRWWWQSLLCLWQRWWQRLTCPSSQWPWWRALLQDRFEAILLHLCLFHLSQDDCTCIFDYHDDDDDDDDGIEVVETYHISRAPRPPCLVHSDPGGKKGI